MDRKHSWTCSRGSRTAAEWMTLYLAKHHESPFILGAEESGLPIVHHMDAISAAVIYADANVRIISRHL